MIWQLLGTCLLDLWSFVTGNANRHHCISVDHLCPTVMTQHQHVPSKGHRCWLVFGYLWPTLLAGWSWDPITITCYWAWLRLINPKKSENSFRLQRMNSVQSILYILTLSHKLRDPGFSPWKITIHHCSTPSLSRRIPGVPWGGVPRPGGPWKQPLPHRPQLVTGGGIWWCCWLWLSLGEACG